MSGDGRHRASRTLWTVAAGFAALAAIVAVVCWALWGGGGDAIDLANSPDRTDRLKAIEALRSRHDAASRETLLRLCGDDDLRVAIAAVWAIGESDDPANAALLARVLADTARRSRIRCEAALTLGKFKSAGLAPLTKALADDADAAVRAAAARGLGRLRDVKAVPALFRALSDPDKQVRGCAIEAMNHMMVRRFPFKPELAPGSQPQVMRDIEAYLREGGAL